MGTEHETFGPDWISPPGETIAELLAHRHLSTADFAQRIDRPSDFATDLLHGQAKIEKHIAKKLATVLGGSVNFWISREHQYRHDLERWRHELSSEDYVQWLNQIPTDDLIRFNLIYKSADKSEIAVSCLRFFGVRSIKAWNSLYGRIDGDVNFRTSATFKSNPAAVATWLRQGELEAAAIECATWDATAFRKKLSDIRKLTRNADPTSFVPLLQGLCADCGVALVVVRAPTECRASGAARFISPRRALIQLSFRYLSDDHFWFSFFHEAGHLLLHGGHELFLEDDTSDSTQEEEEANDFALQILLPSPLDKELLHVSSSAFSIVRFARKAGISPGIVVGQLQFHKIIKTNHFNGLKRRYVWTD